MAALILATELMPEYMVHGSKMRVDCQVCKGRGRVGGDSLFNSKICPNCFSVGTLIVPDPDKGKLIKKWNDNMPLSDIPEFAEFTYYPERKTKSPIRSRS